MKRVGLGVLTLVVVLWNASGRAGAGLERLERLQEERSRRATSAARDKPGDYDPTSNRDNRLVKSGESLTLSDLRLRREIVSKYAHDKNAE